MDEFTTLYHIMDVISSAVKHRRPFVYELGERVKVSYEQYRGKWTVGLRQYYSNDNGDVTPGRYGVNMETDVWKRIVRQVLPEMCKYIQNLYTNILL